MSAARASDDFTQNTNRFEIVTMEAADGSSNKPTTEEAGPTDRTANAAAASNVMSSLAGLGNSSSEDEKQKEKDAGGTSSTKGAGAADMKAASANAADNSASAPPAKSSNDVKKVTSSASGGDAMEVDEPTAAAPSATVPSSPSKPQQSAQMKARGIISTLEASADSAFASKPASLPSGTGEGKKKKKEKDDKKKTGKKKGKDKVKKKKVRLLLYFGVVNNVIEVMPQSNAFIRLLLQFFNRIR